MSAAANTHINGWNSEPAKKGVQFANSVKVRTFEPVTTNYGVNTGETEIVTNQNMTYGNVEAAFKLSRNKMQTDQQKSRQKRIQRRNKLREDYKKQMAENIRKIRSKLEEFKVNPPNAETLLQYQRAMGEDLVRLTNTFKREDKLNLGIFDEEIQAFKQLLYEFQQLHPAPVSAPATTNIAAVLAAETETAGKIRQGINTVEELLREMDTMMTQEATGQTVTGLDAMITQADQTIRTLLQTPKTPEERGEIASLIGQLRTMKERHNEYVLSSVGKKGGSRKGCTTGRKTRKQQQRSVRYSKRSKRSKRSNRSNRMKRV